MVYKINIYANRLCLSFLAPQAGSLSSGISSLSPGLRSESACWSGGSYRRLQRASLQASGSYWPFLWVYCHVLSLCLHVAFSSMSLCPKFPLLVRISVKLHLGFTLNLCDFLFTWWHLQTPYFLLRFCMNTRWFLPRNMSSPSEFLDYFSFILLSSVFGWFPYIPFNHKYLPKSGAEKLNVTFLNL